MRQDSLWSDVTLCYKVRFSPETILAFLAAVRVFFRLCGFRLAVLFSLPSDRSAV